MVKMSLWLAELWICSRVLASRSCSSRGFTESDNEGGGCRAVTGDGGVVDAVDPVAGIETVLLAMV